MLAYESLEYVAPVGDNSGLGELDFNTNCMNMNLTMVTKAKRNMRKVPLVGFIIVGEEEDSTSAKKMNG